ncbi:MAG: hypothetical protein H5T61_05000 [Thermoflexales bacterium]|nr:hypothetical protein [Thermoflexales bacterium]
MTANDVVNALGPYVLVVVLAGLWALTEVIQAFRSDIRRALRSGWSGLLMGINGALALLVFILARLAFPSANPYLLALTAGIGWQALIRTRINLLQPLNPEIGGAVSLSLADLYGRLQRFCWEQTNQGLLSGRIRLLERATRLPVEELEHQVRLFAHASALHPPEQVEAYLEKLRGRGAEERALALAAYLLTQGGYDFLQERLKAMEK